MSRLFNRTAAGTALRLWLGREQYALQFLPPLLGEGASYAMLGLARSVAPLTRTPGGDSSVSPAR